MSSTVTRYSQLSSEQPRWYVHSAMCDPCGPKGKSSVLAIESKMDWVSRRRPWVRRRDLKGQLMSTGRPLGLDEEEASPSTVAQVSPKPRTDRDRFSAQREDKKDG